MKKIDQKENLRKESEFKPHNKIINAVFYLFVKIFK